MKERSIMKCEKKQSMDALSQICKEETEQCVKQSSVVWEDTAGEGEYMGIQLRARIQVICPHTDNLQVPRPKFS